MPHVIVKMYPGRSEAQKKALAQKLTEDVVTIAQCKETSVSVSIEEVEPDVWPENVYQPDILDGNGVLYKQPEYNPFEKEAEAQEQSDRLTAYVRDAAEAAMQEDTSGYFNAMSWLDLELEDNPQAFDDYFDSPWHELSDAQKQERAMSIRRVL